MRHNLYRFAQPFEDIAVNGNASVVGRASRAKRVSAAAHFRKRGRFARRV
jgi:hypothetical protein